MKVRTMIGLVICLALIVCTLLMIWGFSLERPDDSTVTSSRVASWLYARFPWRDAVAFELFCQVVRKLAHFAEYTLLAAESTALLWVFLSDKGRSLRLRYAAFPLAFGILVASLDEMLQLTVGRGGAVRDVLLDTAGTLFGITLLFLVHLLVAKRKGRTRNDFENK